MKNFDPLVLGIVIPALNEEQSIRSIISRTLKAGERVVQDTSITEVQIVVVSDGSDDKTFEIASEFSDFVSLIEFSTNRGYGAAILEGWALLEKAQLLGFLDADGTCDPMFFIDLCLELEQSCSDVVLGCRMHQESKMTLTRRVGNVIFAKMLSFLAGKTIIDSASGMRVLRRAALSRLLPLPPGLNFTPAMSAQALFSPDLVLTEIQMPYGDREGKSKLSVVKDGLRFLRTIIGAGIRNVPHRVLDGGAQGLLLVASFLLALSGLTCLSGSHPLLSLYILLFAETIWLSAVSLACTSVPISLFSLSGGFSVQASLTSFLRNPRALAVLLAGGVMGIVVLLFEASRQPLRVDSLAVLTVALTSFLTALQLLLSRAVLKLSQTDGSTGLS